MTELNLGIIEGFFGKTWDWQTRNHYAQFLKDNAYSFYIYAPKSDQHLRKHWREDWPFPEREALAQFGDTYHQAGLSWGVGLSPLEIYLNYDAQAIQDLEKRVRSFRDLKLDILAILFDDMRGDIEELSRIQVDVVHRAAELSQAKTVIMCPTYYSDDPVLEKLFGKKPDHYLQSLGQSLDPAVHVFWTGPLVCSKSYPEAHLKDVGDRLGRAPFIWDNYPVNDGAKLSQFLYLRAFEDRPHSMAQWVAGHAVNPMNQAYLSKIPLMTLPMSYRQKDAYSPQNAFVEAVERLCPVELGKAIIEDIAEFQDVGLAELSAEHKQELVMKYAAFESAEAHEIVQWLKGEFAFDPACLTG